MSKGNNRVRTKIAEKLDVAALVDMVEDGRTGSWDAGVFLADWDCGLSEDDMLQMEYENGRFAAWATGGEYPNEVWDLWHNDYEDNHWDPSYYDHSHDRDLYDKWHPDVPILTVATVELYYFNTDMWHIRKGYDVVGVITKHPFDWEVTYHPMIVGSVQEQYTFPVMEASLESLTQFVYMMATLEGEQRYV